MNHAIQSLLCCAAVGTTCSTSTLHAQPGFDSPFGSKAPPDGNTLVRASLITPTGTLVPGDWNMLGIRLNIEPGWHVYWNGQNDTGIPVAVSLDLPKDFETRDMLWPGPTRYISPGDILDHVYEDEVVLIVPVLVPAADAESQVEINASISWLVCKDVCLPGSTTISQIFQAPNAQPERSLATLYAKVERSLPRTLSRTSPEVNASWTEQGITLTSADNSALEFYPDTTSSPLADTIRDGASTTNELTIELAGNALSGVARVTAQGDKQPRFYTIRSARPEGERTN